uniref:NADH-ubiquinone oxidoreductase chain 6 n=1 Tax=Laxta sp. BLA048 TaxID=2093470 RepID=A0A2P1H969_9NEOP|nr:NADH dehydrogenase subunit 6 [Laxta sp. BLA048]
MLLSLSLTLSIIFTSMKHPLAMGLVLLLQTLLISMLTGMMTQSFWFSYILFLIFLGGMLVLFIYVTSLASNEMFYLSTKLIMLAMTTIMVFLSLKIFLMSSMIKNQETLSYMTTYDQVSTPLIKLYNQPTSIMTIIIASYLFLTLIAVVKITNIFKGPLRQMN